MDRRKEENLRVKRAIADALFELISEKNLSDVSISELAARANVARASFYRNFDSKEGVIVDLVRGILDEFTSEVDMTEGTFYIYKNILLSFRYFEKYRTYILNLWRSSNWTVLTEEMNRFHEGIEGNMPFDSMEKYSLYMYIGAFLNTALTWLLEEDRVRAEEIAEYFYRRIIKFVR